MLNTNRVNRACALNIDRKEWKDKVTLAIHHTLNISELCEAPNSHITQSI